MPQPQVCPRCQRVNPGAAVFCFFDGIVLQQGAAVAVPLSQAGRLPRSFVFPSRRNCATMDDLIEGLYYEWDDARALLRQGKLGLYFTSIGRADLARAAQEAAAHADADIGLHQFLQSLPARRAKGPQLDLKPRRLNLTNVSPGETLELPLHVYNLGQGFLQGKLMISEGEHFVQVRSADAQLALSNGQIPLKTAKELRLVIHIDTSQLRAPASHHARLVVITNGGITEVPIRLDLGSVPFPHPPFRGVATPREMAEKMRDKPKLGVPFLERGEVRQWFEANGWSYPVDGGQAKGVAAVQQFFEGMGLSRPPQIQLSESELQLICTPPEVIARQIRMKTKAKKWVYALVESDVHWLRVLTPVVSGPQKADVEFEIDSSLMDPDQIYEGHVHFVANAGQRLVVRVVVDVRRPYEPFTRRLLKPFFTLAIVAFLYRLLLLLPADVYARRSTENGSLAFWTTPAINQEGVFLRSLVQVTWWIGPLAGAWLLWKRGSRTSDVISGAVMGVLSGVAVIVTLGCLMTVIDAVPRLALKSFWDVDSVSANQSFTAVWILFTLTWWTLLGGVVGLVLARCGSWGAKMIRGLTQPFTGMLRGVGFYRNEQLLTAQ